MNRKMFATGGSAENPYFYVDATGNTKYLDQAKLVPILRNTDITALEALIQNPDVTYSPATQEVFRQIVGERKATFSSTDPSLFQFGEFLPDNLTGLSALRDIAGFGLDFAGQVGEGVVNLGRSLTSGFGERSVDDPEFAPLDLIPSQRFPNVPDTITGRPGTEEGFMSGFDKSGILRRGYTNPQLASILDRALGEVQDFSNEIDALDEVTTPVVETEDTLDTEIPTSMTDVESKTFTPDLDAMSEMSTTLGTRFKPGSVGFEREQGRRLAFEQDMIGRDQFGNIIERPDEIQLPPDIKDEIDKTLKEITPIEVLVDTDKTVEQSQAENLIKFDPPEIKLEKVDLTPAPEPAPEPIPKQTTGIFGSDRFLDFIRNVGSELVATGQLGEGLAAGAAKAAEERTARDLLEEQERKKFERDRQIQMENIQAQSQSNTQAAQAAAAADMQKQQGIAESKVKIAQAQSQFDIAKLEREAAIKKELMEFEFQLNMQLKTAEADVIKNKEKYKEDRKDERTKIQASQQSELIDQRKSGTPPKNFESAGFDNLGGFGLEQFDPR